MQNSHEAILRFPARHVRGLPVETRFTLQLDGTKQKIVISSSEVADPTAAGVVFDGIEFAVLVEGVESDRIWPADVAEWTRRKRVDPCYRVTREEALGDVSPTRGRALDLGRVLTRLGLTLESVETMTTRPSLVAVEQAA